MPEVHSFAKMPTPDSNSSRHSAIWARVPNSTGSSKAQVTRSWTGRPWWNSRITAASSMAGATSQ